MADDHLKEAIAKIEQDLAWRGPSDKPAAYVMLTRAQAQAVLPILVENYVRGQPK